MKEVKIKKYKLIKTYPTSPKLGSEVIVIDYDDPYKDFPDNWEDITLIKLEDYQILSFRHINSKFNLRTLRPNGIYTQESFVDDFWSGRAKAELFKLENLVKDINYEIHSVKRFSDDQVFTLGDKVNYIHGSKNQVGLKITKIFIDKDRLNFSIENSKSYKTINVLKHVPDPIPLFKTEDGVDIFEGDKVYFVNITNQRFNIDICLQADLYKSHLLYFSTKEKAEEYTLMNKPCLSINNVLGIYNDPLIKSQLIKLIKNKK